MMRSRPLSLGLENLESRLNLSATGGMATAMLPPEAMANGVTDASILTLQTIRLDASAYGRTSGKKVSRLRRYFC